MKHNPFHHSFLVENEKGLLRELHELYQERATTEFSSFFAILRTTPSANRTTTASLVQMVIRTTHVLDHEPLEK